MAGRFADPSPTPVAGFGSARRPGLGPVTPTAERLGVIVLEAAFQSFYGHAGWRGMWTPYGVAYPNG